MTKDQLSVSVEPIIREAFVKLAEKEGKSVSSLARSLIVRELITREVLSPETLSKALEG